MLLGRFGDLEVGGDGVSLGVVVVVVVGKAPGMLLLGAGLA